MTSPYPNHQRITRNAPKVQTRVELDELARIPEFEGDTFMSKRNAKLLKAESGAVKCTNCQQLMSVVEYGEFLAPDGKTGDYAHYQCENCGFTLHSYRPKDTAQAYLDSLDVDLGETNYGEATETRND